MFVYELVVRVVSLALSVNIQALICTLEQHNLD